MVYLHFPAHLTDEEEMLMKKYAKLKKKKRQLQLIRAQQKQDPKKEEETPKKRSSEEAANATEQAKKLLKAGAIKVASDKKESQGFKKSKRQKDSEKSAFGYQPFTASAESDKDRAHSAYTPYQSTGPGSDSAEDRAEVSRARSKSYDLGSSFVKSSDRSDREDPRDLDHEDYHGRSRDRRRGREQSLPKRGNTVYVSAPDLSEDLWSRNFTENRLRDALSNLGSIVNITMEENKSCAFVTFEKMESADEAIMQMDNTMLDTMLLRVSMARRQPTYPQTEDLSKNSWVSIALRDSVKDKQPPKADNPDQRERVVYEEDFF